jgi:protein-disulfide isomerase
MKLTSETKLFMGMIGATLVIIALAMLFFAQPAKPISKTDLVIPSAPMRGNANAPHYLVEFSDFQCPACKAFAGEVDIINRKYGKNLLEVYRYYPLPQHPEGRNAAQAAAAANVQGKFWEMDALLFANQDNLAPALYASLAAQLKLNPDEFAKSMNDQNLKNIIQKDVDAGDQLGINATPTFYLDGQKLDLNNPGDLSAAVEKILR